MASSSMQLGAKVKTKPVPATLRLNLNLVNSADNDFACYDVASLEQQSKSAAAAPAGGTQSEDEEESRLAALAKRLEEKYVRCLRAFWEIHFADAGICRVEKVQCEGTLRTLAILATDTTRTIHSLTTPKRLALTAGAALSVFEEYFLQYDELVPPTVTTEHGGFYINLGKLKYKNCEDDEGYAGAERPVSRRGRTHGILPFSNSCKAAAKLKKKCLNSPKPRAFKKTLNPATLKNRERSIEAVVDAVVGCQLPCNGLKVNSPDSMENAINATISQVIREEIQATTNSDATTSNGAKGVKIASNQKSDSTSVVRVPFAESMVGQPPTLGPVRTQRSYSVPEALLAMCDELAKMVGSENSCISKWSPTALSQLIEIHKACEEKALNKFRRCAVFRYVQSRTGVPRVELCAFVKRHQNGIALLDGICNRSSAGRKSAMPLDIFLKGHDPLREAVDLLRQEVAATMPALESCYAIDCAKTIRKKQDIINSPDASRCASKQKAVYMPRRRFTWKASSRTCLHAVFNELEKCHQLGQFNASVDLKTLMDHFLETLSSELWPPCWMSCRELRKEYSMFNFTQANVARRSNATATTAAATSDRTKVFVAEPRKRCAVSVSSSEPQRTAHATPVITLVPQRGRSESTGGYGNGNRNSAQISGASGTHKQDLAKSCMISPSKATPVSISVPTKLSISGGLSPTVHHTVLVSPIKSAASLSPNRGAPSQRVAMGADNSRSAQQAAFVKMGSVISSQQSASPPKLMRFSVPAPADTGSAGSSGLLTKAAGQHVRMVTNPFYQSAQSHWFVAKDRDASCIGSTVSPSAPAWSGGQIRPMIVNAQQHLPFLHNVSQPSVMANSLDQNQQHQQAKQEQQLMQELNEMIVRMEGRGTTVWNKQDEQQ